MMPNRYIARRLPIAALVFVSIAHADPCPIPRHPVASADEAVELSKRAIVAYKLTDTPLRCLAVAPSPGYTGAGFEIDVRENHVEGCGEALPMFDPLVMSIHVTPAGTITTTAGATDAQQTYRRPSCPRPPRHGDKTRG
jgi:hypothetical protein